MTMLLGNICPSEAEMPRAPVGRSRCMVAMRTAVTCIMIVTPLCFVNATKKFQPHALPDRPQPGARGRMVEHADPARCAPWVHALRPVPEKPRHRAQHAGAA